MKCDQQFANIRRIYGPEKKPRRLAIEVELVAELSTGPTGRTVTAIRTAGGGNPAVLSPLSPLAVPLLLEPRIPRQASSTRLTRSVRASLRNTQQATQVTRTARKTRTPSAGRPSLATSASPIRSAARRSRGRASASFRCAARYGCRRPTPRRWHPARARLVILDCCFSGQAIEALSGEGDPGLADITHVGGVYTLTATTRNRTAHVPPPGQQATACTSFTGEFCNLIHSGVPGKPGWLTFNDLYPELRQRLRAKGLPAPSQRGTDTAHQFPFTANAAARSLTVGTSPGRYSRPPSDTATQDAERKAQQDAELLALAERANSTGEAGDAAGARDQYATLIPLEERVRGREHPDTLSARATLAYWTGLAGDAAGARDQLAALQLVRERVLGPEQRQTLNTRANVLYWTGEAGDAAAARAQFAALLPVFERVLGREDTDTLTVRNNLAHWTGETGDAAAARAQFAALLPVRERVIGPEDPFTLTTRFELAGMTGEAGDAAAARDQYAALLPVEERVRGPEHPETLNARNHLAYWTERAR